MNVFDVLGVLVLVVILTVWLTITILDLILRSRL